ncbi:hypothetical protein Pint_05132 [Pistacia integerrima]|uniref:Uncharacterized protein n=1 Tax=Pistacia integerrima TaxID=434235 RepID=A0ACC0Z8H1_9ROSI|nr:hypothetical protein Pint_05132 [Pistacia integerrima]
MGDSGSNWGSVRATMRHTKPFNLRYDVVGNEECYSFDTSDYKENYLKFYNAIKRYYPGIRVISNYDGSVDQLDHPTDLYDFHLYTNANDLFSNVHHFDHISRGGPKVFVSEYAVYQEDAGTVSLLATLGEVGFLIGRKGTDGSGAMLLNATLLTNSPTSILASAIAWRNSSDDRCFLKAKVVNFGNIQVKLKISVYGLGSNSSRLTKIVLTSNNVMDETSLNEPKKV